MQLFFLPAIFVLYPRIRLSLRKFNILFLGFSLNLFCSGSNPGDSVFNGNTLVHEIRLNFESENWYDSLTFYYNQKNN